MADYKDFIIERGEVKKYIGTDEIVAIPRGLCGIAEGAFKNNKKITKVIITGKMDEIGASAFEGCENLVTVKFEAAIDKVCDRAFYGCKNLKSINIRKVIVRIGDSVFKGCDRLVDKNGYLIMNKTLFDYIGDESEMVISEDVHNIGSGAFKNNQTITKVKFTNRIFIIDTSAFEGCKNLEEIEFDKVDNIRERAFKGCTKLADKNGFITHKRNWCKLLSYVGTAEHVEIPEYIESIDGYAFEDNKSMKSIIIPRKIRHVWYGAFKNCENLEKITFNSDDVCIEKEAFFNCKNLKEVIVVGNDGATQAVEVALHI